MELQEAKSSPVLHILVIGFHHKLGCQIEFCYPLMPISNQGKNECPPPWKYLPTLALPDGSHNFVKDTVFFNLPSLTQPNESVYGVSCYRQVSTEKLKIRTVDVTRSTVQKSVCCLLSLPIYVYIEVKLSLITDAYFKQGDFSNIEILKEGYDQLSKCFLNAEIPHYRNHLYAGLPLREIVLHWKHKTLQLFKLFLLQKRVICFDSPVRDMCMLILGVVSLYPRLLENGFYEVACVPSSKASCLQKHNLANYNSQFCDVSSIIHDEVHQISADLPSNTDSSNDKYLQPIASTFETGNCNNSNVRNHQTLDTSSILHKILTIVNSIDYRAPLSIFCNGHLCLPYFSLPYMDLLTDESVRSYVVGTSNVLFQQKRHLSDVLVDVKNINMEYHDAELKRQILLTTEDLRFMDCILRNVESPKENAEGSEQWVRDQFQNYLYAFLHSTISTEIMEKDVDYFNVSFVNAFKKTECFKNWNATRPYKDYFETMSVTHPCAGSLSVTDMKLKFTQTMQNSESGRKINQAVSNTSRAVGDVVLQAKGVFINWWSSMLQTPSTLSSVPTSHCSNNAKMPYDSSPFPQEYNSQQNCITFQNNWERKDLEVPTINVMNDEHVLQNRSTNHENNSAVKGIVEIGSEVDLLYRNKCKSDSTSSCLE